MDILRTEKFNTNNAWGFGGLIGTRTYYSNGLIERKARACYRHIGTSSANALFFKYKGEVLDVIGATKAKEVTELVVYENASGFRIAMVKDEGDGFTRNYHEYHKVANINL